MIIFKKADQLSAYLENQRNAGNSIGFVPTMGALHAGHMSLVDRSTTDNGITVCSIFINPTQFNNADDFDHYPVTIEADISLLLQGGCDILFLPSANEVYPPGFVTPKYELGPLEKVLEGAHRPGHFQGVCQVVDRLLDLVKPNRLYMGQKDLQQCLVIRRLLEIRGLDHPELIIVPTVRQADGLALSSRNLRLSAEQRQLATELFQVLSKIRDTYSQTTGTELKAAAAQHLETKGFRIDYVAIANTIDLSDAKPDEPMAALVAATIGDVRLIDNVLLN